MNIVAHRGAHYHNDSSQRLKENSMEAKPRKTSWNDWLLFGHFWIAIAAAGLAWTTSFLSFGQGRLTLLYLLVLTGTLALYSWHRIISHRRRDTPTDAPRYQLVAKYPRLSWGLAIMASLTSLILLFSLPSITSLLVLSIGAVIGIGYILPVGRRRSGLLRRSYLKPMVVAAGWTIITAYFPLVHNGSTPAGLTLGLILGERFLFTLAVAICFDWRDREIDRKQGIKTLAQYALNWSKYAAQLALLGALICSILLIHQQHWGTYAAALLFSYPLGFALVSYLGKFKGDYSFAWLYNGLLTLPPLFIWCIIWIPWFREFALSLVYMIRLL